MKCAFCASVCAMLIATANILPVTAGELEPVSRQIQSVQRFNDLLNSGDFERAEALGKECFLKNSSDPLAVLMLRQVFLARKDVSPQIVFPATTTRSKVVVPGASSPFDSTPEQDGRLAASPNLPIARIRGKQAVAETSRSTARESQPQFRLEIGLGVDNQLIASAMKSCAGGCREPLNAVLTAKNVVVASSPNAVISGAPITDSPQRNVGQREPDGIEWDRVEPVTNLVFIRPGIRQFAPESPPEDGSTKRARESGISLQLIKGSVADLERLGIAIQSETARQISQIKLNAAKDALPTPITVPVLAPATEGSLDRNVALDPLTSSTGSHSDLSGTICAKRERIIRHAGEPLATRRLSPEERQEILKAAQAAPRVSIKNLPKLDFPNDQGAELSGPIVDSMGKILGLGIHSYLTPDQNAVLLRLSFHSEQGPAALTKRITMSEFLESEEALLIALDAPVGALGLDIVNVDRQITYLVISPELRKQVQQKVANSDSANNMIGSQRPSHLEQNRPDQIRQVTAERKREGNLSTPLETRVYPVADLVIPIPSFVGDGTPINGKIQENAAFDGFIKLIKKITTNVTPKDWDVAGGKATIRQFAKTMSLVIKTTPQSHEQIGALLRELRKEFDVQASVEFRVISGDAKTLANAGLAVSPQDFRLSQAELDSRACTSEPSCSAASAKVTSELCPVTGIERCGVDFDFDLSSSDCSAKTFPLMVIDLGTSSARPFPFTDFTWEGDKVSRIEDSKANLECELCEDNCPVGACIQSAVNLVQFGPTLLRHIFLDGPPSCCSEFGMETACCQSELTLPFKLLTAAQQEFLLNAVQGLKDCNVIFAPKITLFNGQTGNVSDGDLSLTVKVEIAADRRSMATSLTVANGKNARLTKVFHGKLLAGESILIPIPVDESMDGGKDAAAVSYLLLTPKVMVLDEEEEAMPANQPTESTGKTTDRSKASFYVGFTR